jgi:transcriptional regulator with XRE-family HTH domain
MNPNTSQFVYFSLQMATMGAAFGLAVRFARGRRHWSQEQLAEAAGLHRAYVSRIERGDVEPGLSVQERIAAALGISLAELIADAERERERYRAAREQEWPPTTRPKAATNAAPPALSSVAPANKKERRHPADLRGDGPLQRTKQRPVAMAVVVQDGLALMTHRRYKEPAFQWNFVSGEVEPEETPEEAAIREVREEVGLEVVIEHRLGDRIQPVSKRHMYYFICREVGGDVDLVDHEENTEVAWCTLPEVYEHFQELAQIPDGMYKPLFEYFDRVLVASERRT